MPETGYKLHFGKERKVLKQIKKENFPSKVCVVCQRPFVWRKKWAKVWEEVKYCSDACRGASRGTLQSKKTPQN